MAILEREFEGVTFGEAGDAEAILAQVQRWPWDLLILDIGLPDRTGLEVLGDIRRLDAQLPVLIFSMYPEDRYALRILRAGASGYICKDSPAEELIAAIRKVLGGRRYVSATFAEALAQNLGARTELSRVASLSDRELEILKLIAGGKTQGQIAHDLQLAKTTVSTYRSRILEKTNLVTTTALIRYAIENHLV